MLSSISRQFTTSIQVWGNSLSRHYAKGLVRQPLKVFSVDGREIRDDPPVETSASMRQSPGRRRVPSGFTSPTLERDILGNMEYVWLKDSDKRLKTLRMVCTERRTRTKKNLVALEGGRLVADALHARANVKAVYFSRVEALEGLNLTGLDGRLFKVKHAQLEYVTGVTSPPGIMALVEMPTGENLASSIDLSQMRPITLILDNIRDPGNMGSLLRSAAAVGCYKILVTSGNVDIWDPKVLRAGAGCHFRTHILHNLKWPMIQDLLSDNCTFLLADNYRQLGNPDTDSTNSSGDYDTSESDGSTPSGHGGTNSAESAQQVDAFSLSVGDASEVALVVGGETHGLSHEAYKAMRERGGKAVQLPMVKGVDSLNAAMAGTVLMYEVRRQMDAVRKAYVVEDESSEIKF